MLKIQLTKLDEQRITSIFLNQYIATLTIHSIDDSKKIILTKNDFSQQIINNNCLSKIEEIFNKNIHLINFEFIVITKEKITKKIIFKK